MHLCSSLSALALLGIHSVNASPTNAQQPLPIVDLGYVKQQASSFDQEGSYYNFSNIAYAQPPLGKLRWAAPKPPLRQTAVQNGGSVLKICPQAYPLWLSSALYNASSVPVSASETEDCLYLDVFVPQKIFDKRSSYSQGAPVLVWIYGGGFVLGSKTEYNPRRLIEQGTADKSSDGAIYVAMNYRLGNFGFLGGPAYRADGGVPNLGLLDARLALEWVQSNIQKFGGDPGRITLLGESGGAESVAYQITSSFKSNDTKPFQQAIFQSPGQSAALQPASRVDILYKRWLNQLNVTSLAKARSLDTAVLQKANRDIVYRFAEGQFDLSPSADGVFVMNTAVRTLLNGHFDPSIKIMTAYNEREGSIFVPTSKTLVPNFTALVRLVLPDASQQMVNRIVNSVYPPPSSKTPYSNEDGRFELFAGDQLVTCNAVAIAKAVKNKGYAYKFSVSSPAGTGYHTQDLDYTYYNGPVPGINGTVATAMQSFIMNFAIHGDPNYSSPSCPAVPIYGPKHQMLNLTSTGFNTITDNSYGARCDFWNTQFTQPA